MKTMKVIYVYVQMKKIINYHKISQNFEYAYITEQEHSLYHVS